MTLRQAVFLRLCFPFANERSDYVLKSYGVERFLKELGQGEMPLFLTKSDREHIKSASSEEVDRLLAAAEEAGQKVISFFDNAYPDSLRRIQNSPILLFYQGDITLLEGFCVSVVGSRIISDYGMVSLATLSYELAKSGAVVVSGFARGGDAAAHKGALLAKGRTVGVCGCGLDQNYPEGNEELREEIKKEGLLLSEFFPGTPPRGKHFPVRNRILAGLSKGVLLGEASTQSGALITAHLAKEQEKEVFVIPGSIFSRHAAGSMACLREGGIAVANANDLLAHYQNTAAFSCLNLAEWPVDFCIPTEKLVGLRDPIEQKNLFAQPPAAQKKTKTKGGKAKSDTKEKPKKETVTLPEDLSETAKKCYAALSLGEKALPELAEETGEAVSSLFGALTELELLGLIRALPGRRYEQTTI